MKHWPDCSKSLCEKTIRHSWITTFLTLRIEITQTHRHACTSCRKKLMNSQSHSKWLYSCKCVCAGSGFQILQMIKLWKHIRAELTRGKRIRKEIWGWRWQRERLLLDHTTILSPSGVFARVWWLCFLLVVVNRDGFSCQQRSADAHLMMKPVGINCWDGTFSQRGSKAPRK